jgi:hypothetical protein
LQNRLNSDFAAPVREFRDLTKTVLRT